MKLIKRLTINGEAVHLVKDDVRLELLSPGRAEFRVLSEKPLEGVVTLDLGYSHETSLRRWFTGYVEHVVDVNANEKLVFCREWVASINRVIPLSLRHVTLRDVVEELHEQTGLVFRVPDSDYSRRRVPCFYSLGGGYHIMDAIGQVFDIPDFIWQQQGNSDVFVGSWADSFWADKPAVLPISAFTNHTANRIASIKAVPQLRPGVRFNDVNFIKSITLVDSNMSVSWSKQLRR